MPGRPQVPKRYKVGGRKFARGLTAKAECPICGLIKTHSDFNYDYRGAYVCNDCNDEAPWWYKQKVFSDPQGIRNPRPPLEEMPTDPADTSWFPVTLQSR
jgi:hypothetical protein